MAAVTLALLMIIGGVWWNRQGALEAQRQIALAQRLVDQSTELLESENGDAIQRGVLLILQALIRLERERPDLSENGEAAQARLAADQNLRRALSLFYTPTAPLRAAPPPQTYADNGWASLDSRGGRPQHGWTHAHPSERTISCVFGAKILLAAPTDVGTPWKAAMKSECSRLTTNAKSLGYR